MKHGFSVEEELDSDFISLIVDRWETYDSVATEYTSGPKSDDDKLPLAQLANACMDLAGVIDPLILFSVAMDTGNHIQEIAENSINNDLFKPGRPVG